MSKRESLPAGPVLVQPEVRAFQRGYVHNPACRGERASFLTLKDQAETPATIPPNVKVTRAEPHQDGRYLVDASTFRGGDLTREWRQLRGASS